MAAIRTTLTPGTRDRRTAAHDGLACTLFHIGDGVGTVGRPSAPSAAPGGFTVADLAVKVNANTGDGAYTTRQAAYDLRKLRSESAAPAKVASPATGPPSTATTSPYG